MRKQEIIQTISSEFNLPLQKTHDLVDTIFNIIKEEVCDRGNPVTIRGFGTFTKKHRATKQARNISKGTFITVEEHDVPFFRPSKDFTIRTK